MKRLKVEEWDERAAERREPEGLARFIEEEDQRLDGLEVNQRRIRQLRREAMDRDLRTKRVEPKGHWMHSDDAKHKAKLATRKALLEPDLIRDGLVIPLLNASRAVTEDVPMPKRTTRFLDDRDALNAYYHAFAPVRAGDAQRTWDRMALGANIQPTVRAQDPYPEDEGISAVELALVRLRPALEQKGWLAFSRALQTRSEEEQRILLDQADVAIAAANADPKLLLLETYVDIEGAMECTEVLGVPVPKEENGRRSAVAIAYALKVAVEEAKKSGAEQRVVPAHFSAAWIVAQHRGLPLDEDRAKFTVHDVARATKEARSMFRAMLERVELDDGRLLVPKGRAPVPTETETYVCCQGPRYSKQRDKPKVRLACSEEEVVGPKGQHPAQWWQKCSLCLLPMVPWCVDEGGEP